MKRALSGGDHQGFGLLGGRVDVIAEDVVVLKLQAGDAGFLGVARLQSGDDFAAIVAQCACFIERRVVARSDEAAIAGEQRQIWRERAAQDLCERGAFGVGA